MHLSTPILMDEIDTTPACLPNDLEVVFLWGNHRVSIGMVCKDRSVWVGERIVSTRKKKRRKKKGEKKSWDRKGYLGGEKGIP